MIDSRQDEQRRDRAVTAGAGFVFKELPDGTRVVFGAGDEAGRALPSAAAGVAMLHRSRGVLVAVLIAAIVVSRASGGWLSGVLCAALGLVLHQWWLRRALAALPPSDERLLEADTLELRRRAARRGVLVAPLLALGLALLVWWVYPLNFVASMFLVACSLSMVVLAGVSRVKLRRLSAPVTSP
jgi:hypothetical protein